MNNNMSFDGYGYPDMNLLNSLFLQKSNANQNQSQGMNLNTNINMNSSNMANGTNNLDLAQPYEGYIRGNMFDNLYQQYKNYRPAKLVPSNEQAELLLNVGQMSFAAHELRLYLDVYPNDTSIIDLYNQYQKQASDAVKAYEKKYGPILADSPSAGNTFSWEAYAWPWEMEEL